MFEGDVALVIIFASSISLAAVVQQVQQVLRPFRLQQPYPLRVNPEEAPGLLCDEIERREILLCFVFERCDLLLEYCESQIYDLSFHFFAENHAEIMRMDVLVSDTCLMQAPEGRSQLHYDPLQLVGGDGQLLYAGPQRRAGIHTDDSDVLPKDDDGLNLLYSVDTPDLRQGAHLTQEGIHVPHGNPLLYQAALGVGVETRFASQAAVQDGRLAAPRLLTEVTARPYGHVEGGDLSKKIALPESSHGAH